MTIHNIFSRLFATKSETKLNRSSLSTKEINHSNISADTRPFDMRKRERGNVFFTLFGAVAIVGVLGAGVMSTMRGPLSTMVEVNRMEEAKAEMRIASRLILVASKGTDMEATDDGFVEGVQPDGTAPNTVIPSSISAEKNDPWGRPYRYCAWDHGVNADERDGTGNYTIRPGSNDINEIAIVLISSGPDRTFQTECADDPNYVVQAGTTTRVPIGSNGHGDDLMESLSYADAIAVSGGLWEAVDANTAKIERDIEVEGGAQFAGRLEFDNTVLGAANSLAVPDESELRPEDCDGDDAANDGIIRINTATTPNTLELCDGGNTWEPVNEAYNEWADDGSNNISHDGGNVSTTQTLTGGTVASTGDTNVGGDLNATGDVGGATATITGAVSGGSFTTSGSLNAGTSTLGATSATTLSASGTLTVGGVADINNNLEVSGTSKLDGTITAGADLTVAGNTTITGTLGAGNTTITGTLGVSSTSNLAAVNATGAVDFDTTLNVDGNTTIGGTLGGASGGDLELASGVKVGNSSSCSGTDEGTIRYNGTKVQYCNGSSWKGFTIDMLREIENVDITSDPTDKWMLMWSDSTSKWVVVDPGTLEVADADSSDESLKLEDTDNDTSIEVDTAGNGSADTIVFTNDNTQSMFIDNTGRVGIGAGTPVQNLHINDTTGAADVLLTNNTSGHLVSDGFAVALDANGTDAHVMNQETGDLFLGTANTARIVIDETGGVGIGNGTTQANASALFDLTSTTKGFLPPRMTEAQRNAISSPATGLQIFNTSSAMLEIWDGTEWNSAGGAGGGLECIDDQIMIFNATSDEWECGGLNDVGDGGDTGGDWGSVSGTEVKLVADDAAASDRFGQSVAVDGDTIVVGANYDDSHSGSAYVFVRNGSNWVQQAKLTASDGASSDYFGSDVSISGDTVVVGAYGDDDDGSYSGSAYVFVRSGTSWSEQAKLTASDGAAGQRFGGSVSVSGDTVFIGSYRGGPTGSGSAYVFVRSGTSWSEQAQLTAVDRSYGDEFGSSVSFDGSVAVIGAPQNDDGGTSSGSAYVFVGSGSSWSEQAKLTASDAIPQDRFGTSVSISDDAVVVGSPHHLHGSWSGSAYVFSRAGTSWSEKVKLTASDAAIGDYFGLSIAVDDFTAVVAAPGDDDAGPTSGSAYVYDLSSGLGTGVTGPVVSTSGGLIDNDADTQIQVEESPDEDKIRFDTAGVERAIIDELGNVGIGTSAPAHPLEVNGNAKVAGMLFEIVAGDAPVSGGGGGGGGGDFQPDPITFTALTDESPNIQVVSNSVTISGLGPSPASVSITGDGSPEFRISGGAWTTGGSISNGQTLELRMTTSSSTGTAQAATVTVGTLPSVWNVSTGSALFAFTSHTFTGCGLTNSRVGPTLTECRTAYTTTWDESNSLYTMSTQGIQEWTVPVDGTYRITVAGAQGGSAGGGAGGVIRGDFTLSRYEVLSIVAGLRATSVGGGGGSFVWKGARSTPMIVAGGGGGGNTGSGGTGSAGGGNGGASNYGIGNGGSASAGGGSTSGGTGGSGGNGGNGGGGAGGAGWNSDGANGNGKGGNSTTFVGGDDWASTTSGGGFGGGGGGFSWPGGGGGGGYHGGGGGTGDGGGGYGGGGGGSYNSGANQSVLISNSGAGYVVIEKLP